MNELEALLDLLSNVGLEETLYQCSISDEEVIRILYKGGHIDYPLSLDEYEDD